MDEVVRYIADLPPTRRERASALHQMVTQLFPRADVTMRCKIPTYHWRGNVLAWANKKSYFSVYTRSRARIASFSSQYPSIRSGVGCLNFRDRDEFPLADIERVVINALAPSSCILRREQTPELSVSRGRFSRA